MMVVGAALLVAVGAGCGGSSTSGSSSAAGAAATTDQASSAGAGTASGSGSGKWTVVLSNSYIGNAWRKSMVKTFDVAAQQDVKAGLLKSFQATTTSENTATQQIAQIQTLILKHPDAILINAASPTALNGVIQKACSAGIKVVVFDSLATAPCAYTVGHDFTQYGANEGEYIGKLLNGKGNVLEIRGVQGSLPDKQIHDGIRSALQKYPGIKVVAEVDGEASQTTAQQAVQGALGSLPKLDAVLTQGGGDGFGAIQAFKAANKTLPPVVLGNAGNELRFFQEEHSKTGYTTLSEGTLPGQASIALGVAVQLLQGKKVPQHMEQIPFLTITDKDIDAWAKATAPDSIATPIYSQDEVDKLIAAVTANQPLPAVPLPAGS